MCFAFLKATLATLWKMCGKSRDNEQRVRMVDMADLKSVLKEEQLNMGGRRVREMKDLQMEGDSVYWDRKILLGDYIWKPRQVPCVM